MVRRLASTFAPPGDVDHSSASDPRSCERGSGRNPISTRLSEMFCENRYRGNERKETGRFLCFFLDNENSGK